MSGKLERNQIKSLIETIVNKIEKTYFRENVHISSSKMFRERLSLFVCSCNIFVCLFVGMCVFKHEFRTDRFRSEFIFGLKGVY